MKHILICLLWCLFVLPLGSVQAQQSNAKTPSLKAQAKEARAGWMRFPPGAVPDAPDLLSRLTRELGLGDGDQLVEVRERPDDLGAVQRKYQLVHQGVPVEGAEMILVFQNDHLIRVTSELAYIRASEGRVTITPADGLEIALRVMPATQYGWQALKMGTVETLTPFPEGSLIWCYRSTGDTRSERVLAYKYDITTIEPERHSRSVFVDAQTGEVVRTMDLQRHHHCNCCQGNTLTIHHGGQYIQTNHQGFPLYRYELLDNCRASYIRAWYNGNEVFDPNNNFVNNYHERVAASGFWAAEMSYDYFKGTFGRSSYNGSNAALRIFTGHSSIAGNGFWDGQTHEFYFGTAGNGASSDLVSLDIVGHEFTHAVTQYEAAFTYAGESGALEESFSDIFGTMIEFDALNGGGDYTLGEDFWIADGKVRDMQNPNSKQQPDTYGGTHWYSGPDQDLFIYTNMGVPNHAFYLLAVGGSGTNDLGMNYVVAGIGRDKAAAIAYRNLTVYLTGSSDFADAKNGAIWSAMDLFGECSFEVVQTIRAWDAVGVTSTGGLYDSVLLNCLSVDQTLAGGQTVDVRAINELTAACMITNPNALTVDLSAGERVVLAAGFSAGPGLHVFIDPCFAEIAYGMVAEDDDHAVEHLEKKSLVPSGALTVYPNPAQRNVRLDLAGLVEQGAVEVYSAAGVLVLQQEIQGRSVVDIDLSDLPVGLYSILVTRDGRSGSVRVLKE